MTERAMGDLSAGQIDFAKYQRLVNRLVGRECRLKVFDADGRLVWGVEEPSDAELVQHVMNATQDEASVKRYDGPRAGCVLYRSLDVGPPGMNAPAAWAALTGVGSAAGSTVELDRMVEALVDITDA